MMKEYPFTLAGAAIVSDDFLAQIVGRKQTIQAESWQSLLAKIRELPNLPDAVLDNYRRADHKAKSYMLAGWLAAYDAAIPSGWEQAVIDISRVGCHEQNKLYYKDFVEFGRQLGRGHLFVGTLPSTPLCEALLTLNFHGPSFYMDTMDDFQPFWQEIALLLTDDDCGGVLAFYYIPGRTVAMYFAPGKMMLDPASSPETLLGFSL